MNKPKRTVSKQKVGLRTRRKTVTKRDGTTKTKKNISKKTTPGFDGKVKSKEKRDADGNLITYKSTKGGMNKRGTIKTTIKTKKKAKDLQATVKKKTKNLDGTKKRLKYKKSIGRTSRLKV